MQKSMYAQYCFERQNKFVFENDIGFISWVMHPTEMFIDDFYIKPEHRGQKHHEFFDSIIKKEAQANDKKVITCAVNILAKYAEKNIGIFHHVGFKIFRLDQHFIYMKREV